MRKNKGFNDQTGALLEDEQHEPLYRPANADFSLNDEPDPYSDDAAEKDESRFLRTKNRVPVRRRMAQRNKFRRWFLPGSIVLALIALGVLGWEARSFLRHDSHFVLPSTSAIQVQGNQVVTRTDVVQVFARDIGHSIFVVPLEARRKELQNIPWVQSATVMRLLPNRLRIAIQERTPVAYLRDGSTIQLVDGDGVLLAMPQGAAHQYSFPVVTGMTVSDPISTRIAKMHLYQQFMAALAVGGSQISQSVSEVDLADPEDMRAVIADGSSEILVHFGDTDFLPRYQSFAAHRAEWLRQYPHLASVDMRYGRQVVLDMASGDASTTAASTTIGPANKTTKNAPSVRSRKAGH